ncbi:2-dehydro-3-deoxygalactonokinase [Glaciimonas soli]|uniref:2-dehydro-3-deoxygalactonokinase n=1 Tax=Glaciimonas soli TaxID=2590999 RepID=A0A843YPY8_9BURK|nr:2-dehydro-3-deoxygalactonokinase [Glaciimonas soli]MQQ99361.1 2-dehydro-3-deoxygalactonokinase [Glaciimonas soli]
MTQTKLIALDWGTSSLRAYRFDVAGRVLEQRNLPWGIMHLPEVQMGAAEKQGFELAFTQACGDWLHATPQTPVIACGMIGSAQGWCEVPYQKVPIASHEVGGQLSTVQTQDGYTLHIVPGLIQHSILPNVMRGEETQVIGALSLLTEDSKENARNILIGLPGTHSKWVQVQQQPASLQNKSALIRHFDTFMTGEVYAALCDHTILGRTMRNKDSEGNDVNACTLNNASDNDAFLRGLKVAQTAAGRGGVLATIFSTRTLGLTGVLNGIEQRDYLSGLLIGHEIAAMQALLEEQTFQLDHVILIGNATLCARYQQALAAYGFTNVDVAMQATERGLWALAMQAGLIT